MRAKGLISSLLITVALILFFSFVYVPGEMMPGTGSNPKYPGDSGAVIMGDGSEPAEIMLQRSEPEPDRRELMEGKQEDEQTESPDRPESESGKKGGPWICLQIFITREMVVSFLCGAAAVLIVQVILCGEWRKQWKD